LKPAIKICGMRDAGNIILAAELKPDFMGFIFYQKSPRFAGDLLNPVSLSLLPKGIAKAGVFVNADYIAISGTIQKFALDVVQLHGNEPPELCSRLQERGIRVIKAFNINEKTQFRLFSQYIGCTDYFLFDKTTKNHGGSGQKFDWKMLNTYDLGHPFFLSGGIGPGDAAIIKSITNPSFHGIDLNSRFETEPGLKNIERLKEFINELRH
jgi:phosphoribosylanthranilate isomerase